MKRKPRAYIDTSVISALLDQDNPEWRVLTESFFDAAHNFDMFISETTLAEIERTSDEALRIKMREVASPFPVLPLTDEGRGLADEYVRHGAVPASHIEDAYHVATAVLHEMDYLLSWNFRHIVRRRTREVVKMVNALEGFGQVQIMTPPELV